MNGRERRSQGPAELTKAMAVLQDVLRSPWCTPGMAKALRGRPFGASCWEAVITQAERPGSSLDGAGYSVRAVTAGRGAANSEPARKGEERSLLGGARPRSLRHAALLGEDDERCAVSAQQKVPAPQRHGRSTEAGLTVHLCVGAGTLHHETPPIRFLELDIRPRTCSRSGGIVLSGLAVDQSMVTLSPRAPEVHSLWTDRYMPRVALISDHFASGSPQLGTFPDESVKLTLSAWMSTYSQLRACCPL